MRDLIRAGALMSVTESLKSRLRGCGKSMPELGLSADLLARPETLISFETYLETNDRINHLAEEKLLFLRSGVETPFQTLGLLGIAVECSHTLLGAFQGGHLGLSYFQSSAGLDISISKGRCQIRYIHKLGETPSAEMDIHFTLGTMAKMVSLARHQIDPELIVYYPRAESADLKDLITNPKTVSSSVGFVEFDARCLRAPMRGANLGRAKAIQRFFASHSIESAENFSVTELVEHLLHNSMGLVRPTQLEIGNILGINVRALQRALQAEQTTFREILKRVRMAIALKDLANGESVTRTAMKLGYDHPQNFAAAFQGWTGSKPSCV